jgi:hypothetical protein
MEPAPSALIRAWVDATPDERKAFALFVGPAKLWDDLIDPLI